MMAQWRTIPLGEALTFQRGYDITKAEQQNGPFPVFSSSGAKSTHADYKVKGSGVIIGRKGSLGTVFYSKGHYWPHDTTLWVKHFHGNLPAYAYYFVHTMGFERLDAGASNPTLNRNHIHTIPVRFPTLPTQRKIAAILSAYDDLIDNNLRRIKILEEMAQSLYREWFVKLRFPGYKDAQFIDSAVGVIPAEWDAKRVGELLKKVARGVKIQKRDYLSDGPIPVIDQGREFVGGFSDEAEARIGDLPVIVFGDHTRILKFIDFPFACGADGTQLLKSNSDRMPMTLLYYSLAAIDLSNFAYARHFKFLKEEFVLVPTKEIAERFDELVVPLREQMRSLMQRNAILRRTRDLLLPKLISGELDVSELDIAVPEDTA